jgi:peptidoglycan/LPS O-acetylase OafA/YrhL
MDNSEARAAPAGKSEPGPFAPPPGTSTRSVELDFLRGIAILLVMGVHFKAPVTGVAAIDWISRTLQSVGGVGVNLFFTLSGFLVGGLLLKEYKRTHAINGWKFLARRAFKIWPPFYALILFHLIVGRHASSEFFWQNFLQVQNYFGSSITQTWSLAVEEHFYLFLTALLMLTMGRKPAFIITVLSVLCVLIIAMRVVAVSHGQLDAAFRETHLRIDSLLYGVILAAVSIFFPDRFAALAKARVFLVISALALCVFIYLTAANDVVDRDVGYAVQGIGFSLLLVLIYTGSGKLVRQVWYRAISRIGVYSYSIYLWHTLALEPGQRLIDLLASKGVAPIISWFIVMSVQVALALITGIIMTRLVEWPALLLRERLLGHDRLRITKRAQLP